MGFGNLFCVNLPSNIPINARAKAIEAISIGAMRPACLRRIGQAQTQEAQIAE
jgi:hypothetical protein